MLRIHPKKSNYKTAFQKMIGETLLSCPKKPYFFVGANHKLALQLPEEETAATGSR